MPDEIAIRGEMIRLGQLLKLAGIVDSGSEVKAFLAAEPVLVNDEPEVRRGRNCTPATPSGSVGTIFTWSLPLRDICSLVCRTPPWWVERIESPARDSAPKSR